MSAPATPEQEAALNALDEPGRRYRAALAESDEARRALVRPVQVALAAGCTKTDVAARSGVARPDLYKPPWTQ